MATSSSNDNLPDLQHYYGWNGIWSATRHKNSMQFQLITRRLSEKKRFSWMNILSNFHEIVLSESHVDLSVQAKLHFLAYQHFIFCPVLILLKIDNATSFPVDSQLLSNVGKGQPLESWLGFDFLRLVRSASTFIQRCPQPCDIKQNFLSIDVTWGSNNEVVHPRLRKVVLARPEKTKWGLLKNSFRKRVLGNA